MNEKDKNIINGNQPIANNFNTVDTNQIDNPPQFNVANPKPLSTPSFDIPINEIQTGLQTDVTKARSEVDKLQEAFGLKAQEQLATQEEFGASQNLTEATRLSNKLIAEKSALDRKQRALQQSGMTTEQARSESTALETESLQRQADIAILGSAALNNYNAAKQNAKDKVDLEFAPLEAKLTQAKETFKNVQDLYTDFEKKKITSQFNQRENELAAQRKEKEASMEMITRAISQGASPSIQKNALEAYNKGLSQVEIAKTLGVYAGDYLDTKYKLAQINKINQDIANDIIKNTNPTVKTTEGEKASASFANRLDFSNKILDKFENTMKDMTWAQFKLVESDSSLANKLLSPEQQQAGQAMRNFITAKLRKESGAAISPTEFEEARKQYFPQYGDSDEVLTQKKQGRLLAFEGEKKNAGSAYQPLDNKTLESIGVSDNPYKQTLLGGNSAFNKSTGQWNIPVKSSK